MDKATFRVPIRKMMIAIVLVGLAMFAVRQLYFQLYFASTAYSAGYDEGRFRQVRPGMTSEEVEALLGPPIQKAPWPYAGTVNWVYSAKRPGYADYFKREIHMRNDIVDDVISTYWRD